MTHKEHRPSVQRETVRDAYGRIAQSVGSCCGETSSCCGSTSLGNIASAIWYSKEDLAFLPEDANMGLSCGNPIAVTSLKSGETVLDLGCGGGFDVFIAAREVGASGRVIGVDMTPEMIDRARHNAVQFTRETGLDTVEFRLSEIEHLPVADSSVDVVISNCVINLSDNKSQVWREISRVLKPGGRAAISDLALVQPLPEKVKTSVEALVGCVAGAVLIDDTERMIREAGLNVTSIEKHAEYIDAMTEWRDPLYHQIIEILPHGHRVSDYVVSVSIITRKPE